ncbi:hypothetical protein D187_005662 [Cystobacter fuscus DSM 2262]|uniref:Uncharacterized protein n=1 Tax=Cystobacter fuscus (strain ATCC 25194 / DSM 2262 / NBRC 100088 / M29) TaxID=1242864 RepID=S9PJL7_CYSF2|nr:hypothetical protein [Cystobacter fuscus]EPX63256.1 hypothetical protein D187_005662 [Cystobacter fuscus DSM 2262]
MTSTLLVLLLLSQAEGPDNPPDGAMEPLLPPSSARRLHHLARLEATGFALLPGGGTGGVERYVQLTPMLVLDGGEEFGVNLGAPVRLRLGGGVPGAGWVRREDWGQGGTLLFPAPDGTLRPGAFASLGLGVDHAR